MADLPYADCEVAVCTNVDTPYAGCEVPDCTAVDTPYAGCTVLDCTAVDTPHVGCTPQDCTAVDQPYVGCTAQDCTAVDTPYVGCTAQVCTALETTETCVDFVGEDVADCATGYVCLGSAGDGLDICAPEGGSCTSNADCTSPGICASRTRGAPPSCLGEL